MSNQFVYYGAPQPPANPYSFSNMPTFQGRPPQQTPKPNQMEIIDLSSPQQQQQQLQSTTAPTKSAASSNILKGNEFRSMLNSSSVQEQPMISPVLPPPVQSIEALRNIFHSEDDIPITPKIVNSPTQTPNSNAFNYNNNNSGYNNNNNNNNQSFNYSFGQPKSEQNYDFSKYDPLAGQITVPKTFNPNPGLPQQSPDEVQIVYYGADTSSSTSFESFNNNQNNFQSGFNNFNNSQQVQQPDRNAFYQIPSQTTVNSNITLPTTNQNSNFGTTNTIVNSNPFIEQKTNSSVSPISNPAINVFSNPPLNTNTPLNTPTITPLNVSTGSPLGVSTGSPLGAATGSPFGASTSSPFNVSANSSLNVSTGSPFTSPFANPTNNSPFASSQLSPTTASSSPFTQPTVEGFGSGFQGFGSGYDDKPELAKQPVEALFGGQSGSFNESDPFAKKSIDSMPFGGGFGGTNASISNQNDKTNMDLPKKENSKEKENKTADFFSAYNPFSPPPIKDEVNDKQPLQQQPQKQPQTSSNPAVLEPTNVFFEQKAAPSSFDIFRQPQTGEKPEIQSGNDIFGQPITQMKTDNIFGQPQQPQQQSGSNPIELFGSGIPITDNTNDFNFFSGEVENSGQKKKEGEDFDPFNKKSSTTDAAKEPDRATDEKKKHHHHHKSKESKKDKDKNQSIFELPEKYDPFSGEAPPKDDDDTLDNPFASPFSKASSKTSSKEPQNQTVFRSLADQKDPPKADFDAFNKLVDEQKEQTKTNPFASPAITPAFQSNPFSTSASSASQPSNPFVATNPASASTASTASTSQASALKNPYKANPFESNNNDNNVNNPFAVSLPQQQQNQKKDKANDSGNDAFDPFGKSASTSSQSGSTPAVNDKKSSFNLARSLFASDDMFAPPANPVSKLEDKKEEKIESLNQTAGEKPPEFDPFGVGKALPALEDASFTFDVKEEEKQKNKEKKEEVSTLLSFNEISSTAKPSTPAISPSVKSPAADSLFYELAPIQAPKNEEKDEKKGEKKEEMKEDKKVEKKEEKKEAKNEGEVKKPMTTASGNPFNPFGEDFSTSDNLSTPFENPFGAGQFEVDAGSSFTFDPNEENKEVKSNANTNANTNANSNANSNANKIEVSNSNSNPFAVPNSEENAPFKKQTSSENMAKPPENNPFSQYFSNNNSNGNKKEMQSNDIAFNPFGQSFRFTQETKKEVDEFDENNDDKRNQPYNNDNDDNEDNEDNDDNDEDTESNSFSLKSSNQPPQIDDSDFLPVNNSTPTPPQQQQQTQPNPFGTPSQPNPFDNPFGVQPTLQKQPQQPPKPLNNQEVPKFAQAKSGEENGNSNAFSVPHISKSEPSLKDSADETTKRRTQNSGKNKATSSSNSTRPTPSPSTPTSVSAYDPFTKIVESAKPFTGDQADDGVGNGQSSRQRRESLSIIVRIPNNAEANEDTSESLAMLTNPFPPRPKTALDEALEKALGEVEAATTMDDEGERRFDEKLPLPPTFVPFEQSHALTILAAYCKRELSDTSLSCMQEFLGIQDASQCSMEELAA